MTKKYDQPRVETVIARPLGGLEINRPFAATDLDGNPVVIEEDVTAVFRLLAAANEEPPAKGVDWDGWFACSTQELGQLGMKCLEASAGRPQDSVRAVLLIDGSGASAFYGPADVLMAYSEKLSEMIGRAVQQLQQRAGSSTPAQPPIH